MIKASINSNIHGFVLKEKEYVSDISSEVQIFEHEKTGAKLMYIKNNDDNKTFSIGFKTPPEDNTGVMHILEHSVLCGSRKYPVKEPFVELCKSSLNTFLNAMTYSDKTVYPVSSRNEKDFFNLMSVYLDAVFYPNIYHNEKIFNQEGWRYHIENDSDEIIYNGVVYNEMKGALSSPISQLVRKIQETLYPDNAYAFKSGGDPAYIPTLTYANFLDTHKKLYHPSNCYITLYGDLDLNKYLNFINREYLSNFIKSDRNIIIDKQKAFSNRIFKKYKYSTEEKLKKQDYISVNYSVGDINNVELSIALNILTLILVYSEGAPLKKALIDAQICEDVFAYYCSEVLQPYFSVILKGFDRENTDKFLEIVENVLLDLINNGIDKDLIEGCVNIFEFKYREGADDTEPKGITYSLDAMASWIHGSSPIEKLKFEKHFSTIKKAINNSYFEDIIDKYFLKNNHSSVVVLESELNLSEVREQNIKNELSDLKKSLSEKELKNMIEKTKALIDYQNTDDDIQLLETIPTLSINDLEKDVPELKVDKYNLNNVDIYHHNIFTGGISYINVQFNTGAVEQEDICYVGLMANLLAKMDTEICDYIELSNKIMKNLGGLSVNTKEYYEDTNIDKFDTFLNISCKMLGNKTDIAMNIIEEIISKTKFEDKERIKNIIKENISDLELKIMSSGHIIAMERLSSYFSQLGMYKEKIRGIEYYNFLKELDKQLDINIDAIVNKLEKIKKIIFNRNNMRITLIGSKNEKSQLLNNVYRLQDKLPNTPLTLKRYNFKLENKNEALLIPTEVNYVAKGYNFKKLGYDYHGSMDVLEHVLRYGYLWNNIRVKGGAYGALIDINNSGNIMICSYRDPNIEETINIYGNMSNYIYNMDISQKELEKAIIGTISNKQLPLSPKSIGQYAIYCYLTNKTKEDRQRIITDILTTKKEDLEKHSNLMQDIMNMNYQAATSNKNILKYPKLFKNSIKVLGE